MQTSTAIGRWLVMALILVGITGTAHAQRTVTLQLNTATLPDTLDAANEVEIRGAVDGAGGVTLPDGNVIDWNDTTTLKPSNIGGDYWELSFQIPDNAELAFKYYAQQAEDDQIGGWEDGDNHTVAAGTGDVDLGLHYFEKGADQAYDWSPFAEKQDSIGVHFRVYMNTEDALTKGYEGDGTDVIGVRGDPLDGSSQLDWGNTNVLLSQESDNDAQPGFHLYSGMAYYPTSAAGTEQAYKFFVDPDGWENDINGGNRTFTIPSQDTTLAWVYFSDSPPLNVEPVEADVDFSVDLDPLETIGVFRRARGDTLQVRGSFNGWNCSNPDLCLLFKNFGQPTFSVVIPVNLVPGTELEYKYFIDYSVQAVKDEWGVDVIPSGWEEPLTTQGSNRKVEFTGENLSVPQVYNDVFPANIIPGGNSIQVGFSVDMTSALTAAEPFDPAADTVSVTIQDPVFALTQGFQLTPRSDDPDLGDTVNRASFAQEVMMLTDPDGDMVYTGSFAVTGPTYSGIQYKYTYGSPSANTWTDEEGGGTSELGRRRTRFIMPNSDGSWPASFSVVAESFQPTDPLPFDQNPAISTSIETVDGELPSRVTLSDNFPNPFNPTTTFEYSIDRTMDVSVRVYDVLGRLVATLVDGTQQASTYRVSFDAAELASGTYIYRLETPSQVITRTMVLLM